MTSPRTVLFEGSTKFGNYQVVDMIYDGRPARMLFGDNDSPQSGEAHDDNPTQLFSYNQRFLEIAESRRPERILIIGGGAFSLPKALLARFGNIQIDVVELDPLLVELAQRFFALPDDPRLSITTGDGRNYIDSSSDTYDLIVVDAFSEFHVPTSLITHQAAQRYYHCLTPKGLVAINFVSAYLGSDDTLAHRLLTTFQREFATVDMYQVENDAGRIGEQNLLLVACKQPDTALDYLQAAPLELSVD